jgi:hypothetical protein
MRTRRCRTRATGDDGAALIEAALVLPVVITVVFGIIEIGLLFRTASVETASTRSGARLASAGYALNPGSAPGTSGDEVRKTVEKDLSSLQGWAKPLQLWVYKSDVNGEPIGGTCGTSCMLYTWNGTTFVFTSGSWNNPDACGQNIDRVGVFVSVRHDSLTGTSISRTVKAHTVMRLEPKPFGTNAATGLPYCVGE